MAIRYGNFDPNNYVATFLESEFIAPVCAPSYVLLNGKPHTPADLQNENLIQLVGSYDAQTRWEKWFEKKQIKSKSTSNGITVNTYVNLVQATLEGQGVALLGPSVD